MCTICRKFNKGSLTIEEARQELEEQSEYLNEDHIEEVEEMLLEAEDTYDYISEHKSPYIIDGMDMDEDNGAVDESELPDGSEDYELGEDE